MTVLPVQSHCAISETLFVLHRKEKVVKVMMYGPVCWPFMVCIIPGLCCFSLLSCPSDP